MPTDNQQPIPAQEAQSVKPVVLGASTQVIFTIKGFIGTIMTILGIFASFYFLVFVPRAEKVEQYQKELMDKQQVEINKQFNAVNVGIGVNNKSIVDLTSRFNDLNDAVEDLGNTSGGFGGNSNTASVGEPAVDPRLANN